MQLCLYIYIYIFFLIQLLTRILPPCLLVPCGWLVGRLPAKDILPAEVMQAKAANPRAGKTKRGVSPWDHFGVRLVDLVFGPPHYFT